ncbi:MAG: hypothetical protein LBM93_14955 [Oscillospiraceae bacterium]|jgi:hypothetical protein|nr:hypothetical protein [Oscillospiraceae bacterium]
MNKKIKIFLALLPFIVILVCIIILFINRVKESAKLKIYNITSIESKNSDFTIGTDGDYYFVLAELEDNGLTLQKYFIKNTIIYKIPENENPYVKRKFDDVELYVPEDTIIKSFKDN